MAFIITSPTGITNNSYNNYLYGYNGASGGTLNYDVNDKLKSSITENPNGTKITCNYDTNDDMQSIIIENSNNGTKKTITKNPDDTITTNIYDVNDNIQSIN